jgi:hypothetical protein
MQRQPEKTSQTPPTSRATRKRVLLGLGATLALTLALVAGWLVSDEPIKENRAAAPAGPAAPEALAAAAPASGPASSAPLASAAPQPPDTPQKQAAEFDVEALRQLDRQWCSHGAQAFLQFTSTLPEPDGDTPESKTQAEAQLKQWPAHRAIQQLQQQLPERWIASLLQRGDDRSRATALFLTRGESGRTAAALNELIALARGSADPYVAALASQVAPACKALPGCQPLAGAERLAKDPNNLVAFLDAYGDAPDVLQRLGATQARLTEVRNYNMELLQTLLSLPLSTEDGLYREVEQVMLMGIYAAWRIPNFSGAMSACRKLAADAATERASCQRLAEALWAGGESMLERALAVGLAKTMRLQEQQADWLKRQQQLETVRHQSQTLFQGPWLSDSGLGNCEFQRRLSGHLRALGSQGEWRTFATQPGNEAPPARP